MSRRLTPDHSAHDHCGCCGRCFVWLKGFFCVRCRSSTRHLGHRGETWDRTYEAVHGEPCPFADSNPSPFSDGASVGVAAGGHNKEGNRG